MKDTLKSFLKDLSECKDKFKWVTNSINSIRAIRGKCETCFCPITAVIFNKTQQFFYPSDARLIGTKLLKLDSDDVYKIIKVSDGCIDTEDEKKLNEKIKESVGAEYVRD